MLKRGLCTRILQFDSPLPTLWRGTPESWRGLPKVDSLCKASIYEQLLHTNMQRFRGGLVFKAHRHLYHSTLGLRVIKKKKKCISFQKSTALSGALKQRPTHSTCLKRSVASGVSLRYFQVYITSLTSNSFKSVFGSALKLMSLQKLLSLVARGAGFYCVKSLRSTCVLVFPYSGRDCVKSFRSSYTGFYTQNSRGPI